jgi:hypothetical protein
VTVIYVLLFAFALGMLPLLIAPFAEHCQREASKQPLVCNPRNGVCRDKITGERVS